MSRNLAEWLTYQERVNAHSIELGLDRVREVWQRMGAPCPARQVITVAGTNGKGPTVALLEAMLAAAGCRVGAFTSPHLLAYNERIRIDGAMADDADLFARAGAAVAVLEVGLGGRLDAVNIIDADVAVITTIGLEHMDWLGPDRDSIGREKAGIARRGRPVIVGELDPPVGLLAALTECRARVERAGIDFSVERHAHGWRWRHRDGTAMELPDPPLAAPVQYANAAAAIAALHALQDGVLAPGALFAAACGGLHEVRIAARLQALGGEPRVFVDVGHNPQAARALAEWLDTQPPGGVHAVYGALADKDVAGVMAALGSRIDHWHLAGLERATPRGRTAAALAATLRATLPQARFDVHADVAAALAQARQAAHPGLWFVFRGQCGDR